MMCDADSRVPSTGPDAAAAVLALSPRAHHAQSALCEARAPYRQGRRLTAVKVYSVCSESAHLLVCGVPALGLRRELRALLARHGRLLLLAETQPAADAEPFTCTYRARYADARAARSAKRAHDGQNWYGGSLHVCYAPELESAAETREKLALRRHDVAARLRRLHRQQPQPPDTQHRAESIATDEVAADAGGAESSSRKRRRVLTNTVVLEKQYRPCFLEPSPASSAHPTHTTHPTHATHTTSVTTTTHATQATHTTQATQTAESARAGGGGVQLNYDKFGAEEVRAAPPARLNRIRFNIGKR